jgi:hypothetical protein
MASYDYVPTRKIHAEGVEIFRNTMAARGFVEVPCDRKHPIDPKSLRIGEFACLPRFRIQNGLMPRDFVLRMSRSRWMSIKVHALLNGEVHTSFWRSASYALESKEDFYVQIVVGVTAEDISLATTFPETLRLLKNKVTTTKNVSLITTLQDLLNGEFQSKIKSKQYI